MASLRSIVGCSLASLALSSPLQHNARQYSTPACAQVAAAVATQNVTTPTVPAQLAYDCITSVPLNQSAALDLIDSMVTYIRWQSTTVWLKNPPEEYAEKIQPPNDVWGHLGSIRSKVQNATYKNEFEFGWDLYELTQTTHDGHFVFVPDVIGTVFNWARPVPLVSVSETGEDLPKPFVYPDILAASLGNATFTPSAITTINGQNATQWLENWAQFGSLQDRDALYNNVFYNLASVSIGSTSTSIGTFAGSGRGRWVYPGATTELCFENGTTITYTNYARVLVPFDGITDGESLYQTFFTEPKPPTETAPEPTPTPSNSTTPTSTPTPSSSATVSPTPAPGYPPPVFREAHNLIGGYYIDDEDYSDVAVLSVPSFVSDDSAEEGFQQVGEKFLAAAKAAGKTKLVIDVSANGGGTILQGYDLYKQIFPQGLGHAAGDRFRAFESTDLLGQIYSSVSEGIPRVLETDNETLQDLEYNIVSSVFNYQTDLDVNSTNFPNWPAKFGPVEIHGDNFTNIFRWNLSDVLTPLNSGGIFIHGYGPLANYSSQSQPFATEDIIVVTDGYCASTCTIFSELMRQNEGVKFVSLGGRARPGITQAIGGVKGTNDLPWDYIQSQVVDAFNVSTPEQVAYLNTTELGEYFDNTPFYRMAPGTAINVNFRDGYRDNGPEIPLQFIYEASDCRILYTKAMTYDATAIWKAVADSAWGGKNKCIAGEVGGYKTGKRETKRAPSIEARAIETRVKTWRRSISEADYPMDLFTDLRGEDLNRKGYMFP